MAKRLRIGDDRREAVDWFQDLAGTTRPQAERAVVDMLREGAAITSDDGIFLLEAGDEEIERFRHRVTTTQPKNWTRLHSRAHHKRFGGKRMGKLVKTDYSSVANNLMFGSSPDEDEGIA